MRAPTLVVWAMWAGSLVLALISLATARVGGANDPGSALLEGFATASLATVGAVLVTRLPRHRIGWLLALGGFVIATGLGTSGLADYWLNVRPGGSPVAIWLAWLSQWLWAPEIACLFVLLPLFYPSGDLPSPRWRVVAIIGVSIIPVGGVGSALSPWVPNPYPVANPLAVAGMASTVIFLLNNGLGTMLVVSGGILAVASLIVRYRHGSSVERQQLRWFAAVAAVTGVAGVGSIAANIASGSAGPTGTLGIVNAVSNFLIYAGLALLPVAIGLAVLRYRLYEIDRLISRTVSWAALTAVLGAVFVAVVLLLQAILAPFTRTNALAVAGSTLLVAALFQSLRARVQRRVDRRFNRARYDAELAVAAFGARLRNEVDLDVVGAEIASTISSTLDPASVSVWLLRS